MFSQGYLCSLMGDCIGCGHVVMYLPGCPHVNTVGLILFHAYTLVYTSHLQIADMHIDMHIDTINKIHALYPP